MDYQYKDSWAFAKYILPNTRLDLLPAILLCQDTAMHLQSILFEILGRTTYLLLIDIKSPANICLDTELVQV